MLKYRAIACVFAIATLILMFGCHGEVASNYLSRKIIRDPDTGMIVYQRDVGTAARQALPPNAAGPTTQTVGEAGTVQTLAGTHERTAEQIIAENGRVLYWIGAGFLGLSVVAVAVLRSKPLALGAGTASVVSFLTPKFLHEIGPWLLPIGAGAIVIGAIYFILQRRRSDLASTTAAQHLLAAEQLITRGEVIIGADPTIKSALTELRVAIDALAQGKPVFDKAVRASKAKEKR